jgi:hypothetical protein
MPQWFPVTRYKEQWAKLLAMTNKSRTFITAAG